MIIYTVINRSQKFCIESRKTESRERGILTRRMWRKKKVTTRPAAAVPNESESSSSFGAHWKSSSLTLRRWREEEDFFLLYRSDVVEGVFGGPPFRRAARQIELRRIRSHRIFHSLHYSFAFVIAPFFHASLHDCRIFCQITYLFFFHSWTHFFCRTNWRCRN